MKLKCLACEALARPVYLCAARSPHVVDVEMYRTQLGDDAITSDSFFHLFRSSVRESDRTLRHSTITCYH